MEGVTQQDINNYVRIIMKKCRCTREEAEDAVSTALLEALELSEREIIRNLKALVITIAQRRQYNALRKDQLLNRETDVAFDDVQGSPGVSECDGDDGCDGGANIGADGQSHRQDGDESE